MQQAGTRGRSGRAAWLALGMGLAGAARIGAAPEDYVVRTTPAARLHRLEVLRFARDWQRELCGVIELGFDPLAYGAQG